MPYRYLLMRSGQGLAVHLAEARSELVLCGAPATGAELRVPFELNGCRSCAKVTLDRGTRTVWEIDETQIDLEEFLAS
jgi:hypothetical protein